MAVYAPLAAVLAALLTAAGTVPYLLDVGRNRTRPHRGTWAIWSVIGIIGTLSHRADGARWSVVVVAAQTLTTVAVLVLALALRRGVGGLSSVNTVMLAIAALGVTGWARSSDPTVATVCVVLADALGVAMMLPKTWTDPHSETLTTFGLAAVGGLLGVLAVGRPDHELLILPGYLLLANALLAAVITGRRAVVRRRPSNWRPLPRLGCGPHRHVPAVGRDRSRAAR